MYWREIGAVGVDSGQVSIIKEDDVQLWTERGSGPLLAIAFWGRDDEQVAEALREKGVTIKESDSLYYFSLEQDKDALLKYQELAEREDIMVVNYPVHDNPYDRLFLNGKQNRLKIQSNLENVFYSTGTFHGDGVYSIFKGSDGFLVWFDDEPTKDIDEYVSETIDTISADESTSYLICDPCYIDRDCTLGGTITLNANHVYTIKKVVADEGGTLGFWIDNNSERGA